MNLTFHDFPKPSAAHCNGVFERYPEQITGLTEGTQGVYALYRRQKLYYIGLASDLKRRIKWHLKDRHKGKWDRFSLYIIRKTDHIREVESVVVRIAEPHGNKQRGRLGGRDSFEFLVFILRPSSGHGFELGLRLPRCLIGT